VTIHPVAVIHKFSVVLLATLKPLGIWGLGALALIDSGLFPIPVSMDGVLIGYVASNHHKFLLYCIMAAAASVVGSLVPYYVGRAGGELFLLKRINRDRYERMRDKFERQEFLAIMIPAMMPPPMPIKLFEFGAGVFEMKPLPFSLAIFLGKFIQFMVCALITIFYGPAIADTARHAFHDHFGLVIALLVTLGGLALFFILRKLFDRRRGTRFPAESALDENDSGDIEESAENNDSTLIT
jgi:membrane protein YqaA with SNARE-associated domain